MRFFKYFVCQVNNQRKTSTGFYSIPDAIPGWRSTFNMRRNFMRALKRCVFLIAILLSANNARAQNEGDSQQRQACSTYNALYTAATVGSSNAPQEFELTIEENKDYVPPS